ncbi:MAG TPA: metal-dependent hydrolase [Noviherbaspirillum sp.]|nr:metal-dependent hydrolase [Noviherbaspirillum sp.]
MDNISHSVVGLATGELVHRSLPQEADGDRQNLRRRLLLLSCWLASNFPDLDLFLTPLLPEPLGYLLHHRGHTHTLLYAIPQALFLWATLWLLWPSARKLLKESAAARSGVIISVCLGFTLHLLMDYLNSYGLHPFHPFDSRWLYGDMVFILEPVFWIAFGVPMAMTVRRPALKIALLVLLFGAPLFFTIREYLAWGSLAALALIGVVPGAIQHKAGAKGRQGLVVAFCMCLGFIGVQGVASGQARHLIAESVRAKDPSSELVDVSLSSFPTNPLCWAFVSVERNDGAGSYALRRGILSLAPDMLSTAECPASLSGDLPQNAPSRAIAFVSQENGKLDMLRKLKDSNCYFKAWLRFARAPSVNDTEASDIRFSSSPRGNFTTLNFAKFSGKECPRFVPEWDFPRSDLLSP